MQKKRNKNVSMSVLVPLSIKEKITLIAKENKVSTNELIGALIDYSEIEKAYKKIQSNKKNIPSTDDESKGFDHE